MTCNECKYWNKELSICKATNETTQPDYNCTLFYGKDKPRKVLHMKIEIEKFDKPSECGVAYSITGDVQEHGETFGFGSPYTEEEWKTINVEEKIKRHLEPSCWGLRAEEYEITYKIVKDFRARQTTLFG